MAVKKGQKRGSYKKKVKEVDIKEEIELVLNPTFQPLFFDNMDDPRYYQVYGGRGSGKSFAVALAMVELTYSKYQHKILYLRQTMASSDDSVLSDVKNAIQITNRGSDFREIGKSIVNIKTGGSIIFKGIRSTGNQTAKLKSLSGVSTLVIEEAEEVENFEEFSKIDESIRMKGKPLKVILIYNPTSSISSWIHKEWFVNGEPKDWRTDTIYMHSTYLDNLANLNPSIIARYESLKKTNFTYYVNVILAKWTLDIQNQVYGGWKLIPFFNNDGDVWYGLDFGYGGHDKTSLVKINYFEKTYYIEEMFSKSKLGITEILENMRRCKIPFNAVIYADYAVPLLIDEIRTRGFSNIRKCIKGNVEAEIKKVQDKDIVIVGDDQTSLYHSYSTFARGKDGKLPHEPDELAATRYAINSRKPIENPDFVPPKRMVKKLL